MTTCDLTVDQNPCSRLIFHFHQFYCPTLYLLLVSVLAENMPLLDPPGVHHEFLQLMHHKIKKRKKENGIGMKYLPFSTIFP